ncbi:aquaporin-4 isoform X4 [Tachysurus fulvidraco]|uniref:aquaporin-4 isoform X4 n=1 Tax=Tachysurus fulvidraco TaxID=1234273 RepID=UPI001FEE8539|nr:aquaporin-4 isoform X4 [Tachysurus fulvidraco]
MAAWILLLHHKTHFPHSRVVGTWSPSQGSLRTRRCVPSCPCTCDQVMVAFKDVWTKGFWRAVSGEFLAMLIFVLLSLGSTINWAATTSDSTPPPPDLVLISLCFGLSIATLIQCFSQISGAHINPAVTVAMVATRKLSLAKGIFYLGAQCLGAILGAAILYGVTPPAVRGNLGVTSVSTHISAGHALVVELFITFELVFTIFATCDPKRTDLKGSTALAIGLSVCIGHLFAYVLTDPLHWCQYESCSLIWSCCHHRALGKPLGVLVGSINGRSPGSSPIREPVLSQPGFEKTLCQRHL